MDARSPLLVSPPLVVRCHFSDESVALLQWLFEKFPDESTKASIHIVVVDTGWSSERWKTRVAEGIKWAGELGFATHHLFAPISFSEAVVGRGVFPTKKYQWCASLLKGLPVTQWLNTVDPTNEYTIVLAKRNTRQIIPVQPFVEECPFHGDRAVWHPIADFTDEACAALIQKTPFCFDRNPVSEECYPCIRHLKLTAQKMDFRTRIRVNGVESKVMRSIWGNQPLDAIGPYQLSFLAHSDEASIQVAQDAGCAEPFGCGL